MSIEKIEKNAIVRVTDGKNKSGRHGHQGIVVGFGPGSEPLVKVWFGREYDAVMNYDAGTKRLINESYRGLEADLELVEDSPRVADFETEQLKVEECWSLKNLAIRYWPASCDSFIEPSKPFVAGGQCQAEGCEGKTVQRIIFTFWDTLKTADVCEMHAAEYDRMTLEEEDFPWRGDVRLAILRWVGDMARPFRRHANSNGAKSGMESLKRA
jgi:hypothetical protein